MKTWADIALDWLSSDSVAMITLAAVEGSTPREAGARMIVTRDRAHGTVGGGNLEFLLVDQARRLLESDLHMLQQDYPLGPLLAQCCGGHVRVLIERIETADHVWLEQAADAERDGQSYTLTARVTDGRVAHSFAAGWPDRASEGAHVYGNEGAAARREPWSRLTEHIRPPSTDLYVFGAGHVGRALVNVAEALPFRLHWRDTRPELAGSDPRLVAGGDLLPVIAAAPAGSYFVVLTHAHEIDYQAVRAILRRADAGYCGLIGSATKRARFVSRLTRDGLAAGGLTCPIGGGMIRSKLPAAIAVATSLELLQRLEAQASSASNANVASQCSPM